MFISFFSPIFAKNYFKVESKPIIRTEASISAPVRPSLKNENPRFSNVLSFDFDSIYCDVGFSFNTKATDTIVDFRITPLNYEKVWWAFWMEYHFYDYFDIFREHDFLTGSYVVLNFFKPVEFKLDTGVFLKLTDFYNPIITNEIPKGSYFLGFSLSWDINKLFKTFFEAKSLSLYDYPPFGTVFFTLGLECNCTDKITIGCDYKTKYIDMGAVAENISEMLLRFYMRFEL